MNTVNPTTTANPAQLATDSFTTREERQLQLPINKIVRATVTEGGQNRVMLELDQRLIHAETRSPLQTGQKLNLLVTATSPRIELQVVEDPLQGRLTRAIHLLGHKWDIHTFIRQLMAGERPIIKGLSQTTREALMFWLPAQQPDGAPIQKGEELRRLFQYLGYNLKANPAKGQKNEAISLKSALMELLNKPELTGTDVTEKADRLLQGLELYQLCQLRLAQQDVLFFPLPLSFLEQGYMVMEGRKQRKEEGETPPLKLTLHLSLDGLGDLRIDLLYDNQGLYIRFACDSSKKASFVSSFQEELNNCLKTLPLQGITFAHDAANPAKSLLKKILPDDKSVLNTRV